MCYNVRIYLNNGYKSSFCIGTNSKEEAKQHTMNNIIPSAWRGLVKEIEVIDVTKKRVEQ